MRNILFPATFLASIVFAPFSPAFAAQLTLRGGLALAHYPYEQGVAITGRVSTDQAGAISGGLLIGIAGDFRCIMRSFDELTVAPTGTTTRSTVRGSANCQSGSEPSFDVGVLLETTHAKSGALKSASLALTTDSGDAAELSLVPIRHVANVTAN